MGLTKMLEGILEALHKVGVFLLLLFFKVGQFFPGASGGSWLVSGQPMHSHGVEWGVQCTRHIWGGVVDRRGRSRRFFLVGGLGGLLGAGVILVPGLGLDL